MATIVNARDLLLQATPAAGRVLDVTMASNIIVGQDNVEGLGLAIAGSRLVFLSASTQVFQIAKTGTVSPAATELTATLRNLTNTPAITVIAGTITSPLTLVDGKVTINNTALTTDTATLRLTVVQDGETYTDEVTIVKVREGADGLVGFLTNESHTVPADFLGNVTNYAGSNGSFKVFAGTTDITSQCTFAIQAGGNPSALGVTLGATTGVYSITGGMPSGTEVTTLTLTATFGTAVLVKVFTLGKTRLPSPARFIDLQSTSQVFQILKDGAVSPASITFTARSNSLAGTPVFSVSPGTVTITSTPGSSTCNLTYANMGASDSATVTVTQDGLSDVVTVIKVREGIDSVSGYLTNEATIIPTTSTGTGGDFSSAGGTFKVFQGIVDKTGNGVTYSIPSSTGVTISLAQTGVYTVTGMTTNSGTALLRAVVGGVTIDKVYSIAKSVAGTNGANGTNGTNGTSGTNGVRGSRTFYVPLAGGTNTYSDTLATTTASVEGGPVMNDLVIQYNSSVGFSQSKFYQIVNTVGSWAIVNAVVDGNLLVSGTVAATHIQANTFTADNAVTRGLTVRDLSGNIILSSGQPLDYTRVGGTKPPADATKGATFGSDILGKINSANASTYIEAAAINDAQIGTLNATKINTGFLSADRIQAGAISADKLNIGSGRNLLKNSTWVDRDASQGFSAACPKEWRFDYNSPNPNFYATPVAFVDWCPIGMNGIAMYTTGVSPSSVMLMYATVPVIAGKRYEFNVYSGSHRCRTVTFTVWLDNNGNQVGSSNEQVVNDNETYGGRSLAEFKQIGHFGVAPAGATQGRFYIQKFGTKSGFTDSYGFYVAPMVAEASANQTVFSNYSPSGLGTKISGAGIETNTITADKINGTNLAVVNGTFSGSLQGATGSFSGSLSAATGSFSGSLTASAVNAVNSINIAGEAVTVPRSAAANNLVNIGGEVQILASPNTDFGGIPIAVFIHTEDESIKPPYYKLYRNGTFLDAWFGTQTRIYIEAPGGAVQYTLNAVDVSGNGDPCVARRRSFVLIGCRR